MLQMESLVQVADNTGARTAKMIGVIGKSGADQAHIGDIITCHIRESIPTASVKKGTVVKAVVVRTSAPSVATMAPCFVSTPTPWWLSTRITTRVVPVSSGRWLASFVKKAS